eukprot:COSAG04_NODE_88_length_27314_cov_6.056476_4_plen_246_part_00
MMLRNAFGETRASGGADHCATWARQRPKTADGGIGTHHIGEEIRVPIDAVSARAAGDHLAAVGVEADERVLPARVGGGGCLLLRGCTVLEESRAHNLRTRHTCSHLTKQHCESTTKRRRRIAHEQKVRENEKADVQEQQKCERIKSRQRKSNKSARAQKSGGGSGLRTRSSRTNGAPYPMFRRCRGRSVRFATPRCQHRQSLMQTAPRFCLGALATVSWPWVPARGSLEPPRRDGENAQKTGKNG